MKKSLINRLFSLLLSLCLLMSTTGAGMLALAESTPTDMELFGDVNGDGRVDGDDLRQLLAEGMTLTEAAEFLPLTLLNQADSDFFEAELWSDARGTTRERLNRDMVVWRDIPSGAQCGEDLTYNAGNYPVIEDYEARCLTLGDLYVTSLFPLTIEDTAYLYVDTLRFEAERAIEGCAVLSGGSRLTIRYVAQAPESEPLPEEVLAVQALIDALPTVAEAAAMDIEGQRAVYARTQEAYEAYKALTEEQQALIAGLEKVLALFDFFNGFTALLFSGGSGTSADPYLISSLDDLMNISNSRSSHFRMTENITITGSWTPLCKPESQCFTGTLDGDGHTILYSGVSVDVDGDDAGGLFSFIGNGAVVKNLNLTGSLTFVGSNTGKSCGPFAGNLKGRLENCSSSLSVTNTTSSSPSYTGAFVGYVEGATIINCSCTGTVTSSIGPKGAFIAFCNRSTIQNCLTTVNEAFVGWNLASMNVSNTYSRNGGAGSTQKTDAQFRSGEVAWLLQNGQSGQVWGQTIGTDDSPRLTSATGKRVWRVTFTTGRQVLQTSYVNHGNTVELPDVTLQEGAEWAENGETLTASTAITRDWDVIARRRALFGSEGGTVTTVYGQAVTQNLDAFMSYDDSSVSPDNNFTYTLLDDRNTGAMISGNTLSVPGTVIAGSYELSVKAQEKNGKFMTLALDVGTDDVTFTVTLNVSKVDPQVSVTANSLIYDGTEQALVQGSTTGGTLQYSTDQNGSYTADIPTGTDAGDYTVWYRVVGDANNNDIAARLVTVVIQKAPVELVTASEAIEGLQYTGERQALVTAGETEDGTMVYSLTGGDDYTEDIPSASAIGMYTVWYKVLGDDNHTDTDPASVEATIGFAGEGTAAVPYEIPNLEVLESFRDYVNGTGLFDGHPHSAAGEHFKLLVDIAMPSTSWVPIGFTRSDDYTHKQGTIFAGTFNGGHHRISGLTINAPDNMWEHGLFGSISGDISNLTVSGSIVSGGTAGGIVGIKHGSGMIQNCFSSVNVTSGIKAGGIAGIVDGGTVTRCGNSGSVSAASEAGGIAGSCNKGGITECWNMADIRNTGDGIVGGIVGGINASVTNCYSTGSVSGGNSQGAITATIYSEARITRCFYLDTCPAQGIGTAKTKEQFASGEVAWLLQNGRSAMYWGQAIGSDPRPIITGDENLRVRQIIFSASNADYATVYADNNGTAALPAEPTRPNYAFSRWATTDDVTGATFDATTTVTADMTVYAIWQETYAGEQDVRLTAVYGEGVRENLDSAMKYAAGTDASGKFDYAIEDDGGTDADIDGSALVIPATQDVGEYTLTVIASEKNARFTTYALGSYGTQPVTLTVTVTITQAEQDALSITGQPASVTYGDEPFTLTTSGGSGTGAVIWTVTEGAAYASVDDNGRVTVTGAGEVVITATKAADRNYKVSTAAMYAFTVNRRQLTPVLSGDATKVYDGTTDGPDGLSIALPELIFGDAVTATAQEYTYDAAQVGQRTVTATGITLGDEAKAANYELTATTATLSGKIIPKEIDLGERTFLYDGGDTFTMETKGVTLADGTVETLTVTVATASRNAGDYAPAEFTAAWDDDNYDIIISKVTIAPLTAELVWPETLTFTYDGEVHGVTATVGNKQPGDADSDFTLTYEDNEAADAGEYVALVTGLGNGNYALPASRLQAWTIEKARQDEPAVKIDFFAETLVPDGVVEYSLNGEDGWQVCAPGMPVTAAGWDGTEAVVIWARYAKDANHMAGAVVKITIPARPDAPKADIALIKSETAIDLRMSDALTGCEFALDGGTWQPTGAFEGLTPGQTYALTYRMAATETSFASFSGEISVTTVNEDGSTTLQPGETTEAGGNTVTNDGDRLTSTDRDGNTTTVTPAEGAKVEADGSITVPENGTVQTGDNPEVTLPKGGKVDPDGSITADEVVIDDTTVRGENVKVNPDGTVTVPEGATIENERVGTFPAPAGGGTFEPKTGDFTPTNGAGTVSAIVRNTPGTPAVRIDMTDEALRNALLTEREALYVAWGWDAEFILTVENIDSTIDAQTLRLVEQGAGEYAIGQHLEITLTKTVAGVTEAIHETETPIRLVITIAQPFPDDVDRSYAVVRVHDGAATLLPDGDVIADTVTILTDRFSTYSIVYMAAEEPTAEPTATPTVAPTEEPTPEPTEKPTAEPTEEPTEEPTAEPTPEPTDTPAPTAAPTAPQSTDNPPRTGDDSMIWLWIALLALSGAGVAVTLIRMKSRKK